jgi:hypothetical protein
MGFVQSTFLIGLAAALVPLVIHLIFRRQTRQVHLGTIRFLTELLNENARRRRIKKWLLLSCRMLAMALLACAFARPYLLATQTHVSDRVAVILVDHSASMAVRSQGERLADRASARAREILRGLGDNTRCEVAFFDHRVQPLAGDDRNGGSANIAAPDSLSGATDYGAAMAWARDLCVKADSAPADLYVLTDLQRSGLDWTSTEPFPPNVTLHIEDVGQALVDNVAVTAALPSRTVVHPGEGLAIDVTLFNFGPMPHEDRSVSLTLSSTSRTQRMRDTVSLEPGKASQVTFEVPALGEGPWTGLVSVEAEDQLQFDNQRHFFVLAAPPQRVLLVDGARSDAPQLAATFYLEAALRLAPRGETFEESPFAPDLVRFADEGLPPLDAFDQVVLADVGTISGPEASRLGQFVRGGGGLLVFTGEQMTAEACAALQAEGLQPGRIAGIERSRDLPFRWQSWTDAHPLFEPFRDPQFGDLRRLAFTAYTRIEPDPQVTVLARYRDDAPALLDRRVGEGRVLWFTSSADRSWGDWPRSRLYVPLVHQMLGDLAGLTGGGPVRAVTLDADLKDSEHREPGILQMNGRWHVLNVSPRESETDRCTPEEFAHRFGLQLPDIDSSTGAPLAAAALSVDLRDDEVWHWVVLALLVLLCGEAFLANRTTV